LLGELLSVAVKTGMKKIAEIADEARSDREWTLESGRKLTGSLKRVCIAALFWFPNGKSKVVPLTELSEDDQLFCYFANCTTNTVGYAVSLKGRAAGKPKDFPHRPWDNRTQPTRKWTLESGRTFTAALEDVQLIASFLLADNTTRFVDLRKLSSNDQLLCARSTCYDEVLKRDLGQVKKFYALDRKSKERARAQFRDTALRQWTLTSGRTLAGSIQEVFHAPLLKLRDGTTRAIRFQDMTLDDLFACHRMTCVLNAWHRAMRLLTEAQGKPQDFDEHPWDSSTQLVREWTTRAPQLTGILEDWLLLVALRLADGKVEIVRLSDMLRNDQLFCARSPLFADMLRIETDLSAGPFSKLKGHDAARRQWTLTSGRKISASILEVFHAPLLKLRDGTTQAIRFQHMSQDDLLVCLNTTCLLNAWRRAERLGEEARGIRSESEQLPWDSGALPSREWTIERGQQLTGTLEEFLLLVSLRLADGKVETIRLSEMSRSDQLFCARSTFFEDMVRTEMTAETSLFKELHGMDGEAKRQRLKEIGLLYALESQFHPTPDPSPPKPRGGRVVDF
jgi:hypothetical protein